MLGSNLTLLRCYHKSGALSGHDKLIPNAIDALTADLMIQSLAIARPFAELAAYLCFTDNPEIQHLYWTQLFVNDSKLFNTNQLSDMLTRISLGHLDFKLTVNSWRHISIAFKRKLGQFAEELLELDQNDNIDALQAGHSRAVGDKIYGLSPDALAGASEDILPLFLEASKRWQIILHTMPSGINLPYSEITPSRFKEMAKAGQLDLKSQQESHSSKKHDSFSFSEKAFTDHLITKFKTTVIPDMQT